MSAARFIFVINSSKCPLARAPPRRSTAEGFFVLSLISFRINKISRSPLRGRVCDVLQPTWPLPTWPFCPLLRFYAPYSACFTVRRVPGAPSRYISPFTCSSCVPRGQENQRHASRQRGDKSACGMYIGKVRESVFILRENSKQSKLN